MKVIRIIMIGILGLILFLSVACTNNNIWQSLRDDLTNNNPTGDLICPWDEDGAKQPDKYTWKEFIALTREQQTAFFEWFSSPQNLEDWLMVNQPESDTGGSSGMPWDDISAKQPDEYTWEEYEALTGDQQVAFYEWFLLSEGFEDWLTANQPELDIVESPNMPWDKEGAKQPDEYTWEEYEALTGSQQVAFYEWFVLSEDFDDWLTANQPEFDIAESPNMPWDKEGAKQPDEYTWKEYEALTGNQQVAFYEWFSPSENFDDWLAVNEPELDIRE